MNFIKNLFKEEQYILVTPYSQKEAIEIISENMEEGLSILSSMGIKRGKKFLGYAWDTKFKLTYNDKIRMVSIDGVYIESDSPVINVTVKVAKQLGIMLIPFLVIIIAVPLSTLLSSKPMNKLAILFEIIFIAFFALNALSLMRRVMKGKQKALEVLIMLLKAEVKKV